MKPKPIICLGALASLIISAVWITDIFAVVRTNGLQEASVQKSDFPINKRCVVTVDTRLSKPVVVGQENLVTGFSAPDTVEGILIEMDHEWLVLRDGSDENWISRNKVIMIHSHD